MHLEERISGFVKLKSRIKELAGEELEELTFQARNENSWFTADSVKKALAEIAELLNEPSLSNWANSYDLPDNASPKKVGVIMAGNIPAVGFHDFMCVLMSGHILFAKTSSKDSSVIKALARWLVEETPAFEEYIHFGDQLKNMDAYIGTGSNNSSRYFEYYFKSYPHIIRKNRTSIGILSGRESPQQLEKLGNDALDYYGLGCRNVTKLFAPNDYDWIPMLRAWEGKTAHVAMNHKYHNNYDYQKAIYLINQDKHLDNGGLLLKEDSSFFPPVSVVHYEYYQSKEPLCEMLIDMKDEIQCIVSEEAMTGIETHPFGKAQQPKVDEYADGIDTMTFLSKLY